MNSVQYSARNIEKQGSGRRNIKNLGNDNEKE